MYSYFGDVVWSNGRDGGYLVLGNMVYTVRIMTTSYRGEILTAFPNGFLIIVRCRNCMP